MTVLAIEISCDQVENADQRGCCVRACLGVRLTRVSCWLVRGVRHVPGVDDELIAVGGEDRDRHAQRVPVWSKAVRKISKTVASCASPKNLCSLSSGLRAVIQSR